MALKPEEMIALNKRLKELADDIPAWEPERDALQARVKELEEALERAERDVCSYASQFIVKEGMRVIHSYFKDALRKEEG